MPRLSYPYSGPSRPAICTIWSIARTIGLSLQLSALRVRDQLNFTMPSPQKLDTHHKALTLNLDPSTFGSFAEIGAGQEVARWFLLVGASSGTVAKSIFRLR